MIVIPPIVATLIYENILVAALLKVNQGHKYKQIIFSLRSFLVSWRSLICSYFMHFGENF